MSGAEPAANSDFRWLLAHLLARVHDAATLPCVASSLRNARWRPQQMRNRARVLLMRLSTIGQYDTIWLDGPDEESAGIVAFQLRSVPPFRPPLSE